MSSKTGSNTPRADPVKTAAVVTHGKPETTGEALARHFPRQGARDVNELPDEVSED